MYSTGPGYRGPGYDVSQDPQLGRPDYRAPAAVHRESAAHQGEEVLELYKK